MMTTRKLPSRRSRRDVSAAAAQADAEKQQEYAARQKSIPRAVRVLDHTSFSTSTPKLSSLIPSSSTITTTTTTTSLASPKPSFCTECGSRLDSSARFCSGCGVKTAVEAPVSSPSSSPFSSPRPLRSVTSPSPSPSSSTSSSSPSASSSGELTEAEKMRQRILQRKNSSSSSPSPSSSPSSSSNYEDEVNKQRLEFQQQKKQNEKLERQTIIKNFYEKSKETSQNQFSPKFIHIKGRGKVKAALVELNVTSMNEGDVFLLYIPGKIFVWYGSSCNRMERAKATSMVTRINFNECGGRAKIVTVGTGDGGEEFWKLLEGGDKQDENVLTEEAGGNDIAYERMYSSQLSLEKIFEEGNTITSEPIDFGTKLSKSILSSNNCYILECGQGCAYLWSGKSASGELKNFAETYLQNLKTQEGRPTWMYLETEFENGESILFKEQFDDWADQLTIKGMNIGGPASGTTIIKMKSGGGGGNSPISTLSMMEKRREEKSQIDVNKMFDDAQQLEDEEMENEDDNLKEKTIEIWKVNSNEEKGLEIKNENKGILYSGESYVILLCWKYGGITGKSEMFKYVIFYWQGKDCSVQDKGLSALVVKYIVGLVKERGGSEPDVVRVEQGMENNLFKKMFLSEGGIVVNYGKENENLLNNLKIWKVVDEMGKMAVEIEKDSVVLNEKDGFIFLTKNNFIKFYSGKEISEKLKDNLKFLSLKINKFLNIKFEIQEINEKEINQHMKINSNLTISNKNKKRKLWKCGSVTTGTYQIELIPFLVQSILEESFCYILDLWNEVYVWGGLQCYEEDEIMTMELAAEFVEKATDGRLHEATQVWGVKQFDEPLAFKAQWLVWDELWEEKKKKKLGIGKKEESDGDGSSVKSKRVDVREVLRENKRVRSYDELKLAVKEGRMKGLDKTKMESYLSNEEFEKVLNLKRDEFYSLPVWQQNKKRQELGLY